jgi:hypothetical protein
MIIVTHLYYQSVNEEEGAEAKEHPSEDSKASGASQVSVFSSCASSVTDDFQADVLNALR